MGQLADEAHRVGDHHVQRIADSQQTGGGVQRVEQAVVGGDIRTGDGVQQRGFSRVGVAHDGHRGDLVLAAALALGGADTAHLLQLRLQLVDLAADVAAVGLQLGLAGALGADGRAAGAALPLQMAPHADQAGQQVLVLGQLHLQAALLGSGPLGEDVQDQAAAVNDLHAQQLGQDADLRRRQVVIEDHHGGLLVVHHALDLLHLALADEAVGVRLLPALQDDARRVAARRVHQLRQLHQALLVGAVVAQYRRAQAHQHGVVTGFLAIFQSFAFHITLGQNEFFPIIYGFPPVVNGQNRIAAGSGKIGILCSWHIVFFFQQWYSVIV